MYMVTCVSHAPHVAAEAPPVPPPGVAAVLCNVLMQRADNASNLVLETTKIINSSLMTPSSDTRVACEGLFRVWVPNWPVTGIIIPRISQKKMSQPGLGR